MRDPAGRVTQVVRPLAETSTYTYEKALRVIAVGHSDGLKEEFAYRLDGASGLTALIIRPVLP